MTLTWDHKSLVNGEVPPVKIVHVLNPHPYPHCIIFAVGQWVERSLSLQKYSVISRQ